MSAEAIAGVVMGFDFGTRRIGIAIGQTVTRSASPLTTLQAKDGKPDWSRVAALIGEWRPCALVVGLPYNMDDTEADMAPRARRFARQLEGRFHLPVHLVDERLTSVDAERSLGTESSRDGSVDSLAAALIVETWFSD